MKVFLFAASIMSAGVMASEPTEQTLSKLNIVSAEQLVQLHENVEVNGQTFTRKAAPKQRNLNSDIDIPANLVIGEVISSNDGFTPYKVTGEIIVKLSGEVDFTAFNQTHNLSIKQAYQNYYVLKAADNSNLLALVNALTAMQYVDSATIDLADMSISTH